MPFMASPTLSKSLKVRVLLLAVNHRRKCTIRHPRNIRIERKLKKKSKQAAMQLLSVSVQIAL
jgi:hypothetical protein